MKYLFIAALGMFAATAQAASAPYITGGIGKDEREAIMAKRVDYNFEIKSALKAGNFTGDVRVVIENASKEVVLDAMTDGPLFYAKLDAGKYVVKTVYENQTQENVITINIKTPMREMMLRWEEGTPDLKMEE